MIVSRAGDFILLGRTKKDFFMVKIYTRTGDKGQTSLFGGKRASKADLKVEVIGAIDELNSTIGIAISKIKNSKLKSELERVQNDLFIIGASLTTPHTKYLKKRVSEFEVLIDSLTEKLPELRNFILPSGGRGGAYLHLARAICRRAERRVVALGKKEKIDGQILVYLNRLSDLLFIMARFVNYQQRRREIVWQRRR